tara:strand:+ start:265 stop:813 length:549 start_codon:yes stop_codon:yes gene_type:complete
MNENELNIVSYTAVSLQHNMTGVAYAWKLKGDKGSTWEHHRYAIKASYKAVQVVLDAFIDTIEEARERYGHLEKPLRFTLVTKQGDVLRGFNKMREEWESNGYVNRRGNKVEHQRLWKKLFKLSDQISVEVRPPIKDTNLIKACNSAARAAVNELYEASNDGEIDQQELDALVANAIRKDRL